MDCWVGGGEGGVRCTDSEVKCRDVVQVWCVCLVVCLFGGVVVWWCGDVVMDQGIKLEGHACMMDMDTNRYIKQR
jgi:hypothetical protein